MEIETGLNPISLLSIFDKENDITNLSTLFEKACKDNKLEIAQWIYSVVQNKKALDTDFQITELFENSCIHGFIDLAKWLHSIFIFNHENPYSYDYIFVMCVSNNHFSVAEWLLSIKPDIHILGFNEEDEDSMDYDMIELIFDPRETNPNCLTQIQFLYSINNTLIIEHIKKIFSKAMENNKVDVLKWCEEIKPNFGSIYTTPVADKLFKRACAKQQIELVNYIKSKNPDKYHFIINEDGTIRSNIEYILNIRNTKSVQHIDTCSICYEGVSSVVTICDHQYCKTCIQQWLNVRTECPYCRKSLDMDNIFNISQE
jgi:hypothetical protein